MYIMEIVKYIELMKIDVKKNICVILVYSMIVLYM